MVIFSMRWHQLAILLLLLLVFVEAAKKKPSKGELGMMIRMRMSMKRILDDKSNIGMNMRMRTIEDDEVLSVVVEAAKKKPSNGEIWNDELNDEEKQ